MCTCSDAVMQSGHSQKGYSVKMKNVPTDTFSFRECYLPFLQLSLEETPTQLHPMFYLI